LIIQLSYPDIGQKVLIVPILEAILLIYTDHS
jgi:hypothetical protein